MAHRLIDLFSGAGGLTLGFSRQSGRDFSPVWANDVDPNAAASYNLNFGDHCVVGGIDELLRDSKVLIPEADIVIGGPPCQGFSLLNKNRRNDPRKQLWRPFLEVTATSGAGVFVMENVPHILGTPEHREIIAAAEAMGFQTASGVLLAGDYGVPQNRRRAFIVGCRFADPRECFPPPKICFNPNNGHVLAPGDYVGKPRPWQTVRDAIGDLPEPEGTSLREVPPPLDLHFGRSPTEKSRLRYRAIPEEGMNRFDLQRRAPEITPACWIRKKTGGTDLFGRLWWDRPAFTIRTEFFKPEKGRYLHPSQHRPITHREAARLQSFPDWFRFRGSKIQIAKQIGNAVPPGLAARVAECVEELMKRG